MSSPLQDKLEFAIVLWEEMCRGNNYDAAGDWICNSPYRSATLAAALMRLAKRLHRLAEKSCNGGTEEQLARVDQDTERYQAKVAALLKPYGITPMFQGDPRGAVLKLALPRTKRTNGWGGEYCVPQ